jgi:hypothetical protein
MRLMGCTRRLVLVEGADDGGVGGVGFEVVDGHVEVAGVAVAPAVFDDEVAAAAGSGGGGGGGGVAAMSSLLT